MSFVLLPRERVVALSFFASAVAGFGAVGLVASPAQAQSITSSGDTNTQVNQVGDRYTIEGTTISGDGANLFHSFEQFGLDTNEIAEFIADPDIQNILGRVVGGQVSLIDGLIEVTGADANLFLMNPAGIIFGSNAQLNVPADFTATTATGIGFGSDWFSALGDNDYAALVGDPASFAFGVDQPGAIANLGTLGVGEGQTLSLVGGTVLNAGTLEAPGGSINIAAVPGQNLVRISQDGFLLSLDIEPLADSPTQPNAWTFPTATLPELLTGGEFDDDLNVTVNADGTITLDGTGITLPTEPGTALVAGAIDTATDTDGVTGSVVNVVGDRAIFYSEPTFGPRYDPDGPEELAPQPGELTGSLNETTVLAVNTTSEIRIDLPDPEDPIDPTDPDPAQGAGLFFSVGTGNDDEGDLRFTTQGSFVMDAEDNLFSRGRDITIRAGEIIAGEINAFDGAGANYFGPADDDRFPQRSGNVELDADGDIQVTRIFGEDILIVSANGDIQTGSISSEADTFPIPADDGLIYPFDTSDDGINRELNFDADPLDTQDLANLNNVLNQGAGSDVVVIATNGSIDLDGYIRAGQANKTSDSTITITAQRFRAVNPLTVPLADENGQITDENGQSTGSSSVNLIAYSRNTDPPERLGGTTGRNSLQASFGEGGLLSLQFGDQEAQVQVIDENGNPQIVLLSELESDEPILAQIQLLGDTTFSIAEVDELPADTSGMEGGFGVGGRRDPSVNPGALSNSFAALPPPEILDDPEAETPNDPGTDVPVVNNPDPFEPTGPSASPDNPSVGQQADIPAPDFEPVAQVVCESEETVEVSDSGNDSPETPVLDIAFVVSVELLRSAGLEDNEEEEVVTECN
ncbi:MAG: filamentous hemagglutinin N-terminal domain-containing protein [Elainellaceae cyanobacterium]